jgi:L-rhamnose-H+ transport protein
MTVLLGVIFHCLGGFAAGSFYMPFKKVRGWAWESYWIVGGVFAWIIVPLLAAGLTVPGFMRIITTADPSTLFWTYALGVLWGIGGLTFGLSMRFMGLSLGYAIALGLCSAFGALIPPLYRDVVGADTVKGLATMATHSWGQLVLLGVFVCLTGIAVSGKAGMMKEKDLPVRTDGEGSQEFHVAKGLVVAIISGILSACFNFGIEAGKPMAAAAVASGTNSLFQNNATFVVLLWGGFTTNVIWSLALNARNKTFGDYSNSRTPLRANYIFSALAGTTWFLQFFFYGMGESRLGNGASSWILHMAFIILVSSLWGIVLREWRGVGKSTRLTFAMGLFLSIASVMLVGYGNALQ